VTSRLKAIPAAGDSSCLPFSSPLEQNHFLLLFPLAPSKMPLSQFCFFLLFLCAQFNSVFAPPHAQFHFVFAPSRAQFHSQKLSTPGLPRGRQKFSTPSLPRGRHFLSIILIL